MRRWTDNSNWQIFIQKSQLELQSNVPLQENALHDLIGRTKNISPSIFSPCWLTSTVIFHLFPIADDSLVFTSLHPRSPSIKVTRQCSRYKAKKEGVYLSTPMLDMFSTDRKTDSNIVQPQESSSRLAVDGCSLITWKMSGKETSAYQRCRCTNLWWIHIKQLNWRSGLHIVIFLASSGGFDDINCRTCPCGVVFIYIIDTDCQKKGSQIFISQHFWMAATLSTQGFREPELHSKYTSGTNLVNLLRHHWQHIFKTSFTVS